MLPDDEKKARELALTKTQYVLKDESLYHLQTDKMLRVVAPNEPEEKVV